WAPWWFLWWPTWAGAFLMGWGKKFLSWSYVPAPTTRVCMVWCFFFLNFIFGYIIFIHLGVLAS
ncbi:hypothetical protein, partial [Salmonella enterica]|uniref:hypothetical protein n=1 Tax=Salmonella enterica TaxID=28901 RepID=UPI0035CABF4C